MKARRKIALIKIGIGLSLIGAGLEWKFLIPVGITVAVYGLLKRG